MRSGASRFRRSGGRKTDGTELTVILWPKHQAGACLRVLPPDEDGENDSRTLTRCRTATRTKCVLKRFIGSKSVQVTLDKAGRICLPDEMARAAGIKDEAVLVGLLDRFEIWNPARYENVKAADAVLAPKAFELME